MSTHTHNLSFYIFRVFCSAKGQGNVFIKIHTATIRSEIPVCVCHHIVTLQTALSSTTSRIHTAFFLNLSGCRSVARLPPSPPLRVSMNTYQVQYTDWTPFSHLVVDDHVYRSPDGEVGHPRHLHRLIHHALPRKRRVSVYQDRHRPLLRLLRKPHARHHIHAHEAAAAAGKTAHEPPHREHGSGGESTQNQTRVYVTLRYVT